MDRIGDLARRAVELVSTVYDAFVRENKVLPPVAALLALFLFAWVVAGAFVGGSENGRTSGEADLVQSRDPAAPAPEVEDRDADSYAAYRNKDPFRQLLAPAEETTQETTTPETTTGTTDPGGTTSSPPPDGGGGANGGGSGGGGSGGGGNATSRRDSDGDGLTNRQEDRLGLDPRDPDSDGDGTDDGADDSDSDGVPDGQQVGGGGNGAGGAGGGNGNGGTGGGTGGGAGGGAGGGGDGSGDELFDSGGYAP